MLKSTFSKRGINTVKLVIVALAVVAIIAACGQAPNKNAVPTGNTAQTDAAASPARSAPVDDLATARELYTVNCQICHRQTGKGGAVTVDGKKLKPADLTSDRAKKHEDADLIKDISEGAPDDGMPAFKGKLSEEQMKQIVKFIRTLQTPVANS